MKYSHYKNSNHSTGLLFWKVSVLWQRKIREVLQPLDLTHTQFVILAVIEELSEHCYEITQKMISDFSMIDTMTVSSTIRLLEKKQYVIREQSKSDSRAYRLSNTVLGREQLKRAIKVVELVDEHFFFTVPDESEAFQKSLQDLLKEAGV